MDTKVGRGNLIKVALPILSGEILVGEGCGCELRRKRSIYCYSYITIFGI